MNKFYDYLKANNLDPFKMSSEQILDAYNASGSNRHKDLAEVTQSLPSLKELHILFLRLEQVKDSNVKGEHASDSNYIAF